MKAEIPETELKSLEADLLSLRLQGGKDIRKLVASKFKRDGGSQFRRIIREKFTVKATRLNQNMKQAGGFRVSVRPTSGPFGIDYGIRASSKMIGVEYFSGTTQPKVAANKSALKRQRKRGLIIKTQKGAATSRHKAGFVADLNGPKWFSRKNLRNKSRKPLQRIFGPSLYSMYIRQQKPINSALEDTFKKTVFSVIEYQKKRLTQKNARR
jgi:hypothetical protein